MGLYEKINEGTLTREQAKEQLQKKAQPKHVTITPILERVFKEEYRVIATDTIGALVYAELIKRYWNTLARINNMESVSADNLSKKHNAQLAYELYTELLESKGGTVEEYKEELVTKIRVTVPNPFTKEEQVTKGKKKETQIVCDTQTYNICKIVAFEVIGGYQKNMINIDNLRDNMKEFYKDEHSDTFNASNPKFATCKKDVEEIIEHFIQVIAEDNKFLMKNRYNVSSKAVQYLMQQLTMKPDKSKVMSLTVSLVDNTLIPRIIHTLFGLLQGSKLNDIKFDLENNSFTY